MNKLWYNESAADWNSALPVGNGRLGAMVYGRTGSEVIQLNEESVWSGAGKKRINSNSRLEIKNIRKLLRKDRLCEAQALALEALSAVPSMQNVYQTAGEFHIDFYNEQTRGVEGSGKEQQESFKNVSLYKRELDLDTAIASSSFLTESSMPSTADFSDNSRGSSITYSREVFVSQALDVLVVHISASTPKSIYFRACFDRGHFCTKKKTLADDTIEMQDASGIPFVAMATATASGGKVSTRGEYLVVEGADEVTIYIDIETAYRKGSYARKAGNISRSPKSLLNWCETRALEKLCFASCGDYADIRTTHINDYHSMVSTVLLSLTQDEDPDFKLPTDQLLATKPQSAALAQIYWNYNRYLLISSGAKPGTLPANLQGIWNNSMNPPKGGSYGISINTQMNYWGASMTGLGETENALFAFLALACKNGIKTSRGMYGVDGFVAHSNMDIWGDTAPQDQILAESYWPLGAAWLCTHIRDHYEYTMDKKFLRKNFYIMKRACDFITDYMVKADNSDWMVINPSVALEAVYSLPNGESGSLCTGTDMDNRIMENLLAATIQSGEDLGVSKKDQDMLKYRAMLAKIEGVAVTAENTLRELPGNCTMKAVPSDHLRELYGVYPGHSISVERTPEFAQAAKNTLEKRIKEGAGKSAWSQVWMINLWDSLHDQKKSYDGLVNLLKDSTEKNLFGSRENFQIDGNLGSLSAITRMIVQSEFVAGKPEIYLLPCLPEQWKDGSLRGVVLKGNLRLDIEWKDSRIEKADLYTPAGKNYAEDLVIWYKDHSYECRLVDGRLDLLNVLPSTI